MHKNSQNLDNLENLRTKEESGVIQHSLFIPQEYRGIIDDSRASQNQANQAMIRRFNQHSTMVLRVCDASLVQPETNGKV